MVTITNGVRTFRITAGAVKVYKSMGFHVVDDTELEGMDVEDHEEEDTGTSHYTSRKEDANVGVSEEQEHEVEVDDDSAFIEELLEKPLSQWSSEEVKDFVRIKNIDTTGAQKLSQVRGIIKNYLDEEQKRRG